MPILPEWRRKTRFIRGERDPYRDNVLLLLHMDGSSSSTAFSDSSSYGRSVTANGGAQISTAESVFGGASAYFNGSSDSLSLTDVGLGTNDFVIEFRFKTNSSVQYAQLIGNEASGEGFSLLINNNSSTGGQIALYVGSSVLATSSGDWSDNAWHYLALSRTGSSFKLYLDGTQAASGTSSASMSSTASMYIARNNQFAPRNMVGYIDELRITSGTNRGYTGSTIDVPAVPFMDF